MNKIKIKICLHCMYFLSMAILVGWLVFSTPWIAQTINGKSIHEVDFADIQHKYQKDYIYYVIDSKKYEGGMYEKFSISGWAFCETENNNSNRYSTLILRGDERTYELTPYSQSRTDVRVNVRRQLERPDMIISTYVGFIRQFSFLNIKDGIYDLYLCCWENETNYGISYTFLQIIKEGDNIEIAPWSTGNQEKPVSATRDEETLGFLDTVSVDDGMVTVSGWEFIQEMNTIDQSVYVEFTDSLGNSTQYPTKMTTRSDVANAYDDQRYAQSGYRTVFAEDEFKDDTYTVRVYVENCGDVWRSKQYTVIKAGDDITVMQQ